ncbi:MAG: ABC transporter permease, partial [Bacteroidota bacterium]
MIKHFLLTSVRRLFKDRTLSVINLMGLMVGMSAIFLLSKYVGYFYMRDDFHEQRDQIFAIHQTVSDQEAANKPFKTTYNGVAPLIKDEFGEVLGMTRYENPGEMLVTTQRGDGTIVKHNEKRVMEVDPDFLRMFTVPLLRGNSETALEAPHTMVVSASMARKYFGEQDPVGQTLTASFAWGGEETWTITGVFEDYPRRSILKFDALRSLVDKDFELGNRNWSHPYFKSYLWLREGAFTDELVTKMSKSINALPPMVDQNKEVELHLVNFEELVTLSESQKVLMVIGIVLMLVTWINYTNLSIGQSLRRNKEYGVRKVLGSSKALFAKQFLYEAFLTYGLAMLGAAALILIAYPMLYSATGGQMLPMWEHDTPINAYLLAFILTGSLISTVIPSMALSGLSATSLISGKVHDKVKLGGFKELLVSLQLVVAMAMLIGVVTVFQQMRFVQNRDLGFEADQVIVIRGPKDGWDGKIKRMRTLKNEVRRLPAVSHVASSITVPFWWPGQAVGYRLQGQTEAVRLKTVGIDENYFDCYGMKWLAGGGFQKGQWEYNRRSAIINETAMRQLGFTDPEEVLQQEVKVPGEEEERYTIIGVIADYHHESLRRSISAHLFKFIGNVGFVSVRLNQEGPLRMSELTDILATIENTWDRIYPDQVFDYYFQDERLSQMYDNERLFEVIFFAVATIAVIVTFLGIFCLSIFVSLTRRKEIGIRKALGASPLQIISLFTNQFRWKLVAAIVLGAPLAYHLTGIWLANFTYQVSLSVWYFVLPCFAL